PATTSPVHTLPMAIPIPIADITIGPRLRQLRPEAVDELMGSITAIKRVLQPIAVECAGAGYRLIWGWHRLEAKRKLGHKHIDAVILDGLAADDAELAQIDENLIRVELTPAERALHVARRKVLYEAKHPETKKGVAGGKASGRKRGNN